MDNGLYPTSNVRLGQLSLDLLLAAAWNLEGILTKVDQLAHFSEGAIMMAWEVDQYLAPNTCQALF